jgi:hypothetical protein
MENDMASQPSQAPAGKPGAGGALWSRMIAGAAGAALGAFIAGWAAAPPNNAWAGSWFSPLCAGLGAIVGMVVDHYLLSGKDGSTPP